ncbi:uncharacterized protein LOC122498056 [Leptopilina heterotoma]|uniref:uncharacterized protein LOC122498056 n=1 Tax=Leptopilina heterotoma TaxID=63436 RepID=UPI001CA99786|nr:uncharacterized protein LOC122498056 [Leptopilina heterotoma]
MSILIFFILTIIISLSSAQSREQYNTTSEGNQLSNFLNYNEVPNDAVSEILNLKLSDFNSTCLVENEIVKKMIAYKQTLNNILETLHPEKRNHTLNTDRQLSMTLWQNIFNITRDIEICFPVGITLRPFDKWNLMYSVSSEISERIKHQNAFLHEDARCLARKSPEIYQCLQKKVEGEETLFFTLLGILGPQLGLCHENIDAKLCYLSIVSSCNNPNAVLSFKHLLSPPGSKEPCVSLEGFEYATK